MKALYQILEGDRPFIWVRQAEAHELAEHLLMHPFWRNSVRPALSAWMSPDEEPAPRDGIEESADRVYLPQGISDHLLIGLQSIVDGWVTSKSNS